MISHFLTLTHSISLIWKAFLVALLQIKNRGSKRLVDLVAQGCTVRLQQMGIFTAGLSAPGSVFSLSQHVAVSLQHLLVLGHLDFPWSQEKKRPLSLGGQVRDLKECEGLE